MSTSIFIYLLTSIALIVFIASSLKIAHENERFAEFLLGRFVGFKGPGLLFRLLSSKMYKLRIGDTGIVRSQEFVTFDGVDIPISSASTFSVGEAVRIEGFADNDPVLVATSSRPQQHCPKCGHAF